MTRPTSADAPRLPSPGSRNPHIIYSRPMPIEPGYWVHICLYSRSASADSIETSRQEGDQRHSQFPRSLDEIQRKVDRPLDARFSPLSLEAWTVLRPQVEASQILEMSPKLQTRRRENGSPRSPAAAAAGVVAATTTTPVTSRTQPKSPLSSPQTPTRVRNTAVSTPVARFIKESSFTVDDDEKKGVVSTPLEISFGIVHLFRDDAALQDSANANTRTALEDDSGTILAILGVPAHIGPADFLQYIEPASNVISQVRMIREERAQRCMVLLKFREAASAEEFHKMYADQPFDLHHDPDELCRVVYVTKVSISTTSTLPFAYPLLANSDPWPIMTNTLAVASNNTQTNRLTASTAVELPTCPVCLERMDASVTGLMTVTCQHTFHCSCLSRWSDSRCPVCRYTQSRMIKKGQYSMPSFVPEHGCCSVCGTGSDLWVCLICATVGCGRYKAGHAHRHHEETGHLYSLELETQRVWDYAGDGYVHRLIQNKAESKAVDEGGPTPIAYRGITSGNGSQQMEASGSAAGQSGSKGPEMSEVEEKMEAIGLEYSHLLSTQLESQRAFYEDQVRSQQRKVEDMEREGQHLRLQLDETEGERSDLKRNFAVVTSRYESMHKNLERSLARIKALDEDLNGERLMSKGLIGKIERLEGEGAVTRAEIAQLKYDNQDLQEQVRDLMVFLETRDVVEKEGGEELRGGDIAVGKKGKKSGSLQQPQQQQPPLIDDAAASSAERSKVSKSKKKKSKGKGVPSAAVDEGEQEGGGEKES